MYGAEIKVESNLPELDLVGASEQGLHGPLGQLASVVAQLISKHSTALRVQLLAPLYATRQLQQQILRVCDVMRDGSSGCDGVVRGGLSDRRADLPIEVLLQLDLIPTNLKVNPLL